SDVAEQEAREPIASVGARGTNAIGVNSADQCLLVRVCGYVRGETEESRATGLAAGAAAFEIILVRPTDIDTDVHIVPTLYPEQIGQDGLSPLVIDGR